MRILKVEKHKSSIRGLDANLVSSLAYIVPAVLAFVPYLGYFVWFIPVFAFMFESKSRFVRLSCSQATAIAISRLILDVVFDSIASIARENAFFDHSDQFVSFWNPGADPGAGAITIKLIFAAILTLICVFYAMCANRWRFVSLPCIGGFCERTTDRFRH